MCIVGGGAIERCRLYADFVGATNGDIADAFCRRCRSGGQFGFGCFGGSCWGDGFVGALPDDDERAIVAREDARGVSVDRGGGEIGFESPIARCRSRIDPDRIARFIAEDDA